MKFKEGQKVRVNNNLKNIKNFKNGYVDKMAKLEGEIVTIRTINSYGDVWIKEDEHGYAWDERAFSLLLKPTKEELLNMPAGTKIITESEDKKHTEYYYDGSDFESQETYLKAFQINEDLTINNNTKIIKIEIPVYEILYEY